MEIIFVLTGILILAAFIFIIIEYPYYLVSVFVFLHLYNFNLELPGPLDLRGLISVILFMRLVLFDKKNLDLIRELISNKFFILIISFSLYTALVDIFMGYSLFRLLRELILNFTALLIGFVTILSGYGKKTIVLAILISGIFSTGDLIYTYYVKGGMLIKRILDLIFHLGGIYNHNHFGLLCGYALIITFLLLLTKQYGKIKSLILIGVFSLGIILSTSRMNLIVVIITLLMILFIQKDLNINFKKVVLSGFFGVILFIMVAFSYTYILSEMNIKSEFSDQIYWRLVEEPMSFFDEDTKKFTSRGFEVEGSIRWRINHTLRDADVFFEQGITTVLFGFGSGGYTNIGEIVYSSDKYMGTTLAARQFSSHNFYTNSVAEHGIVGLLLFLLFFLLLLYNGIKMIKKGWGQSFYVYLFIYMFISTFGSNVSLTEKFGFILYGCVIGDLIRAKQIDY